MFIESPVFKKGVLVRNEADKVFIDNGPFQLEFNSHNDLSGFTLNEDSTPNQIRDWSQAVLGTEDEGLLSSFVNLLVKQGVVLESRQKPSYDGEYVGHRLVDHYRQLLNKLLSVNPLMLELQSGAPKSVQIGVLLETYYMIRNADWTAPAVLGHWLPVDTRKLLQGFFEEESGHGELLAEGFSTVGLDPRKVRAGAPQPETLSYNLCFYSAANLSPAHFAASIIVPEIPQSPRQSVHDNSDQDILSLLTDIPQELIDRARSHEEIDDEEDHGSLPVDLLAMEGAFDKEQIFSLFQIVEQTTVSLDWLFRGVLRHYSQWDGEVSLARVNESMAWK